MANPIPLFTEESLRDQTVTDEHIKQMTMALDKFPGVKARYNKFCTNIGVPDNEIADNAQLSFGVKTVYEAFKDSLQAWRAGRNTTTAKFQVFFAALDEEGWGDMKGVFAFVSNDKIKIYSDAERFLAVPWKGLESLQIKNTEHPPPKLPNPTPVALPSSNKGQGGIDQVDGPPPLDVKIGFPASPREIGNGEYSTVHKVPRGVALIINNKFEGSEDERKGSLQDCKNLTSILQQLGYEVHIKHDIKSTDLENTLAEFRGLIMPDMDSLVVVIMSHGVQNKLQMADGKWVSIYEKIVYEFDHVKCDLMEGKPKLFIFQSCQGFQDVEEKDRFIKGLDIADVLVALPGIPGQPGYRSPSWGSRYIYAVTKTLMELAATKDAQEIFGVEVDKTMQGMRHSGMFTNDDQQIPYVHAVRFSKKFFFNPEQNK